MPVVIIEGVNGTGKSTLAEALSERYNWPVVRPWRANPDQHLGVADGGEQGRLRALGIPANTFVDDFYVAEMLRVLGQSAILDRSMGSGIAYGLLDGTVGKKDVSPILKEWARILDAQGAFYVHLACPLKVSQERAGAKRLTSKEYGALTRTFDKVLQRVPFAKARIDTSIYDLADVQRLVWGGMNKAGLNPPYDD